MPYIISPYREIEMGQKARVSGHVKIKKVDREGRTTFESEFDNLILDEFLRNGFYGMDDYSGAGSGSLAIAVGTGVQTAPVATDTALGNFLTRKKCSVNAAGDRINLFNINQYSAYNPPVVLGATPQDDYRPLVFETTFDYSEAAGQLTELGIQINRDFGSASSAISNDTLKLLTRALIKDNSGNPVQLSKTNAEKLIIKYELRLYRPNESILDVTLNGQDLRLFMPTIARGERFGVLADLNRDLVDLTDPANLTNRASTYERGYGYRDFLTMNTNYYRGLAHSVDHATLGLLIIKDPTLSALGDYYNRWDIEDPLFSFKNVVDPDTADRDVFKIHFSQGIFGGSDSNPINVYPAPDVSSTDNRVSGLVLAGDIASLDPVTNAPKVFTLPAGYRLDIERTFERTR